MSGTGPHPLKRSEALTRTDAFCNSIGKLGPQYGGSAAAVWEGTQKLCPQYIH